MVGGKQEEQGITDQVGLSTLYIDSLYQREGDNQTDTTDTAIIDDADVEDYMNGLDYDNLILKNYVAL